MRRDAAPIIEKGPTVVIVADQSQRRRFIVPPFISPHVIPSHLPAGNAVRNMMATASDPSVEMLASGDLAEQNIGLQ